ncbi:MAG: hypothetical protein ABR985_08535 [Methanotrichaceae archaeon]
MELNVVYSSTSFELCIDMPLIDPVSDRLPQSWRFSSGRAGAQPKTGGRRPDNSPGRDELNRVCSDAG